MPEQRMKMEFGKGAASPVAKGAQGRMEKIRAMRQKTGMGGAMGAGIKGAPAMGARPSNPGNKY